jgi:hypothetical protein
LATLNDFLNLDVIEHVRHAQFLREFRLNAPPLLLDLDVYQARNQVVDVQSTLREAILRLNLKDAGDSSDTASLKGILGNC